MKDIDTYTTNAHSDDYATEHEEVRGTFAAEPANEDNLTPAQEFDILFGYAEERHNNDPCARPAPEPYDGFEGCWPGDGSGMDDLEDYNQNEANDYYGDE
jgi:hypothetical protein